MTLRQLGSVPTRGHRIARGSAGPAIDADAAAWLARGASANSSRANNVYKALKAVGFTTSNAYADIKAAGGTI